jgi:hypothetical protein
LYQSIEWIALGLFQNRAPHHGGDRPGHLSKPIELGANSSENTTKELFFLNDGPIALGRSNDLECLIFDLQKSHTSVDWLIKPRVNP